MKVAQISQLLGVKISSQNKKEAIEISNHLLLKIIQLFKKKNFGIITFYGINQKNMNQHTSLLQSAEEYLSSRGFNFIKILAQWNIKFKSVMNFREVGYFILNPSINDMIEIAKKFDQSLFIYSEENDIRVYYSDGSRINLEKDSYDFGNLASSAIILNFIDFKMFIDSILDFNFKFLRKDEIKLDYRIVIFSKNKMTFESCLEIIDVHDIRQNGIISFERSKISPAISPKVFHFDEIVWAFKLSTSKVNSEIQVFRSAV